MTYPLLLPPHRDHVITPSFLDGFPSSRGRLEDVFGHLHAYPIRFAPFVHLRHRHQSSSSYPITMKLPYLRQFSTVSHHPGIVLNAFHSALNMIASAFTIDFVSSSQPRPPFYIVSFRPLSYLGHFPIVRHRCGIVLNAFASVFPLIITIRISSFIFITIVIPPPLTVALCIITFSHVPVTITTSPPSHSTSVLLIGRSGGWLAVSV